MSSWVPNLSYKPLTRIGRKPGESLRLRNELIDFVKNALVIMFLTFTSNDALCHNVMAPQCIHSLAASICESWSFVGSERFAFPFPNIRIGVGILTYKYHVIKTHVAFGNGIAQHSRATRRCVQNIKRNRGKFIIHNTI